MGKLLVRTSIAALAGLSVFCHAATPTTVSATPAASADSSCRRIISAKDPAGTVYCGNAQQWAELDRRIAMMKAGVTCRVGVSGKERCMNAADWKQYERQVANLRATGRWGPDEQNDYHPDFSSSLAGAASEQMMQNLQQHQQDFVAAQVAQLPPQPPK